MAGLPSGTITFLFTDIEGSTSRWEQQPERMRAALARHDALIRAAIVRHGGAVVQTMGVACPAAGSRATAALAAALDAQGLLQAEPWDESGPLRVRMALHTGVAEECDGDYYGPSVNRAARLVGIGHGGQVLLSQATYELICDTPPAGASVQALGEYRLKDLTRPERVYRLRRRVYRRPSRHCARSTPARTICRSIPRRCWAASGRLRRCARSSRMAHVA